MHKESIQISGMSCAACAARIEKGLKQIAGVESVNVNLALERATVEYDEKLVARSRSTGWCRSWDEVIPESPMNRSI